MAKEYVFRDEWDADAPQQALFEALADARTYPEWWVPVYKEVEGDCEPAVGCQTRQRFKGKLPYVLKTTSEIVNYEPPETFEVKVVGDLSGKGVWTLTPNQDGGRAHPLRLDRVRRPAAAAGADAGRSPGLPLEPQLVGGAGGRGA